MACFSFFAGPDGQTEYFKSPNLNQAACARMIFVEHDMRHLIYQTEDAFKVTVALSRHIQDTFIKEVYINHNELVTRHHCSKAHTADTYQTTVDGTGYIFFFKLPLKQDLAGSFC